jgi:uncharacterized protein with HEPN domain
MKSVKPHLAFILDTLSVISANTPTDLNTFMNDRNAQDATLMRLQDIGEQLTRIRDQFPEFYEQNQDDSWHKLIGLRNVISHGYREIDFAIIWDIV